MAAHAHAHLDSRAYFNGPHPTHVEHRNFSSILWLLLYLPISTQPHPDSILHQSVLRDLQLLCIHGSPFEAAFEEAFKEVPSLQRS